MLYGHMIALLLFFLINMFNQFLINMLMRHANASHHWGPHSYQSACELDPLHEDRSHLTTMVLNKSPWTPFMKTGLLSPRKSSAESWGRSPLTAEPLHHAAAEGHPTGGVDGEQVRRLWSVYQTATWRAALATASVPAAGLIQDYPCEKSLFSKRIPLRCSLNVR